MPMKSLIQPKATGMEIYSGLHTLGVQNAGFKILGHLESTDYAVRSAQLNFPTIDIRYNNEWGDLTDFFMSDYIFANPPCAIWSSASKHFTSGRNGVIGKEAWRDDVRLDLHNNIHQVAQSLQPKTFAIESVTNAWNHGREFWLEKARDWADLGYSIAVLLQNNMYIGGIQNRKRVFLIAHKYPLIWEDFTAPLTTQDVLERVGPIPENEKRWLSPFYTKLWELSPQVSGSLSRVVRDGLITRPHGQSIPSFLCRRGKMHEPPNLFLSDSTRCHPTEPRFYHWNEMLGLCGLPSTWRSAHGLNAASMELARAVLPGAGEWVARAVLNGLQKPPLRTAEYYVYDFLDAYNPQVEMLLI